VVGSNLLGKVVEVNKGVAEFISKNGGGRPSQEETLSIIEELGVVPEKSMQLLRRVRDVQGMRCSISWDGCVFSDDGDGLEWAEVVSFVLSSRRPVEDVVMKGISMEELTRAMESVLTSREEHVMRRRFLGDGECERKEVARMFGVTPEIIRQIEVVAKRKLRVVL